MYGGPECEQPGIKICCRRSSYPRYVELQHSDGGEKENLRISRLLITVSPSACLYPFSEATGAQRDLHELLRVRGELLT
jgi:hypothetical protein